MKNFLVITLTAFLIFFGSWFILYKYNINSLPIQSQDTLPALFTPISIIKHGNIYLDDYSQFMLESYPNPDDLDRVLGLTPFYLRKVATHYVTAFPLITPLLALPIYVFPVLMHMPITWDNLAILGHLSGALILALSGGFLYLILKDIYKLDAKRIWILLAIYLFGTINFALVSQGMWQHGTLELFIILGLYFVLSYYHQTPKDTYLFLGGLFFGLAVLSRPTAGLVLLFILGFIGVHSLKNISLLVKRYLVFGLGLLPCVLFFVLYNGLFYGNIENQGYASQIFTNWLSPFPLSFFGVWFSPSKGILIYSPIFFFSLFGAYISFKSLFKKQTVAVSVSTQFNILFTLIILFHTLIISFWKHWFGGWSFGYRMSSDVIPFFILLLIPYLQSAYFAKTKLVFYTLLGLSIFIEAVGLVYFDGVWHAAYDKGFVDTAWLWSVKDSEFVFYIRRVLVKLHVLTKACPTCL